MINNLVAFKSPARVDCLVNSAGTQPPGMHNDAIFKSPVWDDCLINMEHRHECASATVI